MSAHLHDQSSTDLAKVAASLLQAVREHGPLTHCITNNVVTNFTANVLLALGAAPAMVDIPEESGMFAGVASGLLINLGTPATEQRAAARSAVAGAKSAGTPWVLDPVAIGVLPVRTTLAAELAAEHPTAVRGNASEILALTGGGSGGRGVDSTDTADAALPSAVAFARDHNSVVAISGERDIITDGHRVAYVEGGSALLTQVTGGGCALGAVIAAFLGAARVTGDDAFSAVVAAHIVYGIAAERAAGLATGPGSFAVVLLDELDGIAPADVPNEARASWESVR